MKKLIALALALVLCLTLVACGGEEKKSGPDKKPAVEEFNKTSAAFNEVSAVINADIESYDEEVITTMTDMANLLNEYSALLNSNEEIDQETLDEMVAWFGEVQEWVGAVKAELGME